MTMIDLEESGPLLARLEALATILFDVMEQPGDELRYLHEAFVQAANEHQETEPVVDLYEFCTRLNEVSRSARVRAAAMGILELSVSPLS